MPRKVLVRRIPAVTLGWARKLRGRVLGGHQRLCGGRGVWGRRVTRNQNLGAVPELRTGGCDTQLGSLRVPHQLRGILGVRVSPTQQLREEPQPHEQGWAEAFTTSPSLPGREGTLEQTPSSPSSLPSPPFAHMSSRVWAQPCLEAWGQRRHPGAGHPEGPQNWGLPETLLLLWVLASGPLLQGQARKRLAGTWWGQDGTSHLPPGGNQGCLGPRATGSRQGACPGARWSALVGRGLGQSWAHPVSTLVSALQARLDGSPSGCGGARWAPAPEQAGLHLDAQLPHLQPDDSRTLCPGPLPAGPREPWEREQNKCWLRGVGAQASRENAPPRLPGWWPCGRPSPGGLPPPPWPGRIPTGPCSSPHHGPQSPPRPSLNIRQMSARLPLPRPWAGGGGWGLGGESAPFLATSGTL